MSNTTSARASTAQLQTLVKDGLATKPYQFVAGAFVLGFVLGGGLFTRLTGRVAKIALRTALVTALPYLQGALLGGVGGGIDAHQPAGSGPGADDDH